MTQIIPIQKSEIGNEVVNSVNARDLHGELAITKPFTQWMTAQIRRASLVEEQDYILLNQKVSQVSGAKYLKEYILTMDAAKHIAMMSQSKKAKEIRNYFIQVEKEYIAMLKDRSAGGLDMETKEAIVDMNKRMLAIQARVSHLYEDRERVEELLERTSNRLNASTNYMKRLPMDMEQLGMIREACEKRGRELSREYGVASDVSIPTVFRRLNARFSAKSYYEIEREYFGDVMRYIQTITLNA